MNNFCRLIVKWVIDVSNFKSPISNVIYKCTKCIECITLGSFNVKHLVLKLDHLLFHVFFIYSLHNTVILVNNKLTKSRYFVGYRKSLRVEVDYQLEELNQVSFRRIIEEV